MINRQELLVLKYIPHSFQLNPLSILANNYDTLHHLLNQLTINEQLRNIHYFTIYSILILSFISFQLPAAFSNQMHEELFQRVFSFNLNFLIQISEDFLLKSQSFLQSQTFL